MALKQPYAAFGLLIVILGLVAAFSFDTLAVLSATWKTPDYSHCLLLIAVAAGWCFYIYRTQHLTPCPSRRGVVVIAGAVFMHIFGMAAANDWITQYALVVLVMGLVVTLLGTAVFRVLFPALFLLSFAVPFPPLMLAGLTADMQLWSSTLSVEGLNLLGIPVYQEGNIIDLGTYKLQVAEACSGLRYLFPLVGFGYLFAMFFEKAGWKRAVLILATIPVAILMNALRILMVGITVDRWGIEMAEGVLHEFEGIVVFLGCLFVLFFLHCSLSFIGRAPENSATAQTLPAAPRVVILPSTRLFISVIALLCCGIGGQYGLGQEQATAPARESFSGFPLHLAAWDGQAESLPTDQIDVLKVSDYVLADYKRGSDSVNFYVAYYASQRHGAAPHSPLVCIGGSGWEITTMDSAYAVTDASGTVLLRVNRALIKNGEKTELVYFWFRERGRDLTSTSERKWHLFIDAATTGRTDGALLRVATPIAKNDSEASADARLAAFIADALPVLKPYLPD